MVPRFCQLMLAAALEQSDDPAARAVGSAVRGQESTDPRALARAIGGAVGADPRVQAQIGKARQVLGAGLAELIGSGGKVK